MKIGTAMIATLFIVCGVLTDAVGADWVSVYSRSGVNFSYDRDNIKEKSPGKIELDAKTTFETDAVRQEIIKERRSRGLSVEGWKKLHHIVNRIDIDCSLKKYHFISGSHYDEGGNLLSSDISRAAQWSPIISNSPMMFTHDAVCRPPGK